MAKKVMSLSHSIDSKQESKSYMDNDLNPMKRNKFPRDTYITRIINNENGSIVSSPILKKLPKHEV